MNKMNLKDIKKKEPSLHYLLSTQDKYVCKSKNKQTDYISTEATLANKSYPISLPRLGVNWTARCLEIAQ